MPTSNEPVSESVYPDFWIVRPVVRTDVPGLLALYRQLKPEDPITTLHEGEEILTRLASIPGSAIWGGFLDGKLVATCALAIIPGLTHGGRPYAVIENVVTDEAFRQKGFGRTVMDAAIRSAWTANAYKVMLMTGSRKAETHSFYQGCGFRADKTGYQIRAEAV